MTNIALITGASAGIGRATALLLAEKGYDIVGAARTPEKLDIVAQEIQALGREALMIPTDVTKIQEVTDLVDKALMQFGKIDLLINNAGICLTAPMDKTTLDDWQKIINVNLWGYIYPIHALFPHFLERGQGMIVNVGSFGGKMPLPNMSAYCTSKYAVTGLTQTLRLELEPKGIDVYGVHPSVTNSDFLSRAVFRGQTESEANQTRQQLQQMLDSAWVSQPEDVAQAIWKAIKTRNFETVVGTGTLATQAYQLAPNLVEWLMKQASKR